MKHPGELIQQLLDDRNITQVEFAILLGRPLKTINEIIKGKARITEHTAIQLEQVFELPAMEWLYLQAEYRLKKARAALDEQGCWTEAELAQADVDAAKMKAALKDGGEHG